MEVAPLARNPSRRAISPASWATRPDNASLARPVRSKSSASCSSFILARAALVNGLNSTVMISGSGILFDIAK